MTLLRSKSLTSTLSIIFNVLWWIECIGFGVLITVILATGFFKQTITLSLPVAFSSVTFKAIPSVSHNGPPGIINVVNGNFYMPVHNNWQTVLLLIAAGIIFCSVLIIITYQLKSLFFSLSKNQPFEALNVLRIRNIGIWLIVLSLLLFFLTITINWFLQSHFTWDNGISLTYNFKFSYLVAGIILIIVAEIFNEGVILKEETNLTI